MVGFDYEKHPTGVFFYAQNDKIGAESNSEGAADVFTSAGIFFTIP